MAKDTMSEKNHMQLFHELASVVPGPVAKGVGSSKARRGKGK